MYSYALHDNKLDDRRPEPPLLRSNSQIQHEATSIFYSANIFRADVQSLDFSKIVQRLRGVIAEHGVTKPILAIHMHKLRIEDLEKVITLVKLMAETDLVLKPKFVPYHRGFKHLKKALLPDLDNAVDLGKKAYEQEWSEQWLEDGFIQWFNDGAELEDLMRRLQAGKQATQVALRQWTQCCC